MKKVLLIGNCYTTIMHFRLELITELLNLGLEVWLSFPNHSHGEQETGEEAAQELGCHFIELKVDRRSINIFKELVTLFEIKKIIDRIKPDCVLTYTIKPNIYGGIVCGMEKIPFLQNITGLGSGFNGRVRSWILLNVYMTVADYAYKVFVQNENDLMLFKSRGINEEKLCLLPGSGVNLKKYSLLEYPANDNIIFLYDARVMKEKGIDEFLYAAKHYKNHNNILFYVCGDCEEDYYVVLRTLEKEGVIKYFGRVSNVIPFLNQCHCLVLPTFYNEGMSNCLLEAAACGRPIITTNHPGCKEIVDDGENGFLISTHSKTDIIDAMEKFIGMTVTERKRMGLKGREKVEKNFDRSIVVKKYIDIIKETIK